MPPVSATRLLEVLVGLAIFGQNASAEKPPLAITRDVAIVGGGASGAHAAVRLREDFGKSVVVIEKQSRLVRRFHGRETTACAHGLRADMSTHIPIRRAPGLRLMTMEFSPS